MLKPTTYPIPSPFRGRVMSKSAHLFNAYKANREYNPVEFVLSTLRSSILPTDMQEIYLADPVLSVWTKNIPSKFTNVNLGEESPMTDDEVRKTFDHTLSHFVCFVAGVMFIDHHFRTNEEASNEVPMYVDGKLVNVVDKIFYFMDYKVFAELNDRKLSPIFSQMDILLRSIKQNVDMLTVQIGLLSSLISTITATSVKTNEMDMRRLLAPLPDDAGPVLPE